MIHNILLISSVCSASIAVVVRLPYVKDFKNPDFLYATTDIAIWSAVEQGLAIIAGSLATLRPLFQQVSARMGFSVTGAPTQRSRPARAAQWTGGVTSEKPQKQSMLSMSKPFGRSARAKTRDSGEAYGMGDLQPMRLKDEMMEDHMSEQSDKDHTSWRIHAVRVPDEESRPGRITMQKEIHQRVDRR